jgi:enterochelin esterase-like enzyme
MDMAERSNARRRMLMLAAGAWLAGCGGGGGGATPAAAAPPSTTPPPPSVPAGTVQRLLVPSQALGRGMPVSVYLPPGHDAAKRYPLLYLMHGYGGDEHAFFSPYFATHTSADHLLAAGTIEPLIMVAPAYHNSFGVNTTPAQAANSGGGTIGPYEDYLIGELLPYIESRWAPAAGKRHIGGVSMGGFAALHLALRHPGMFTRVGAHSAALWDYSAADQFIGQRNWLYPTPALRAERDPMLLAARTDLKSMRFYLDVGASDGLRVQDEAMHAVLQRHGAASTLKVAPGGHDGPFWNSQLASWLAFYAAA